MSRVMSWFDLILYPIGSEFRPCSVKWAAWSCIYRRCILADIIVPRCERVSWCDCFLNAVTSVSVWEASVRGAVIQRRPVVYCVWDPIVLVYQKSKDTLFIRETRNHWLLYRFVLQIPVRCYDVPLFIRCWWCHCFLLYETLLLGVGRSNLAQRLTTESDLFV